MSMSFKSVAATLTVGLSLGLTVLSFENFIANVTPYSHIPDDDPAMDSEPDDEGSSQDGDRTEIDGGSSGIQADGDADKINSDILALPKSELSQAEKDFLEKNVCGNSLLPQSSNAACNIDGDANPQTSSGSDVEDSAADEAAIKAYCEKFGADYSSGPYPPLFCARHGYSVAPAQ